MAGPLAISIAGSMLIITRVSFHLTLRATTNAETSKVIA
jgi:hypothetical protein